MIRNAYIVKLNKNWDMLRIRRARLQSAMWYLNNETSPPIGDLI